VATSAVISNSLRQKHYSILVNALENYAHSNGINVFLHAAQLLRSLGLSVSIVPADSTTPRFIRLPFGQSLESNRPVQEFVTTTLQHWPGAWDDPSNPMAPHEVALLHLQIDQARHRLGWRPRWPYATTIARTVGWYLAVAKGESALQSCLVDLQAYQCQPEMAG